MNATTYQTEKPEIVKGDKRILLIDGKPAPFALARIPKPGETRGNLAAGGRGVLPTCLPRAQDRAPVPNCCSYWSANWRSANPPQAQSAASAR